MIEEKIKIKSLCYNAMFEVVFADKPYILLELINSCCETKYVYGRDKVEVRKNDIPRNSIYEKALKCDYVIILNNEYLYNIEINRQNYEGLYERNLAYIFRLHVSRIKSGMDYIEIKELKSTQINLKRYEIYLNW